MGTASEARLFRVGSSAIHGRGLFATDDIPAGIRIGRLEGPRTQVDGTHVLWIYEDDGTFYGIRGKNDLRFVNHASNPNAEFIGDELWSLRPIAKGEEIAFHYGEEWE